MTSTIELPVWFVLVAGLLALVALIERLLVPSARWFVRRRVNKAIAEVNTRLNIKIRPFSLTKRRVLIDRLVFDPEVVEAVDRLAEETGTPREVIIARIERYAREIVPSFNAYLYFRIGYWLAKRLARSLYNVQLSYVNRSAVENLPKSATVVFVMNHRSNMDYVLVPFLSAEKTALSFAVGEWARSWPLNVLVRGFGGYVIRRTATSPLYRLVLAKYVQMATAHGVGQAVFPEGRLSRNGRLGQPRTGLLSYMLRGFDPSGERDLLFVPIALNYDRIIEDRSLLRLSDPGAVPRSRSFVVRTSLIFIARNIGLMMRRKWHRFGYAHVKFGEPVSMRDWCATHDVNFATATDPERYEHVGRLASVLMGRIGEMVPALPVPVVATALLECESPVSETSLLHQAGQLMDRLEQGSVHLSPDGLSRDDFIRAGLDHLIKRRLVDANGSGRQADRLLAVRERGVLRLYANSIEHHIPTLTLAAPADFDAVASAR